MKKSKRYLAIILCLIMVLSQLNSFSFLSKGASYNDEIWFEEGDELTLEIGESEVLTISGEIVDSDSITWKSRNNDIVAVVDGEIEAVGIGRTYITAKGSIDDPDASPSGAKKTVTAKCIINVENSLSRIATPTAPNSIADNWDYTIYNDEVTITKYKGTDTNVIIPDEIEGKPVTELESSIFANKAVISVEIPNTVKKLGYSMFSDCDKLTNVTLSNSLKVLPRYTFNYCSSLKSINLPESLEEISSSAFNDTAIDNLYIPANVNKIIVDSYGIPTSIKKYEVSPNNNYFSSLDGMLVSKDQSRLYLYPLGRVDDDYILKLPETIKSIENLSVITEANNKARIFISKNISNINNLEGVSREYNRNFWVESSSKTYDLLKINNIPVNCATEEEFDQIIKSEYKLLYDYIADENTLIVSEYLGTSETLLIPEAIGSLKVTKIDYRIFAQENIHTIILPKTLEEIVGVYYDTIEKYKYDIYINNNVCKIINNSPIDIPIRTDNDTKKTGWYDQEYSGGIILNKIPLNSTAYRHYIITYRISPGIESFYDDYGHNEEFVLRDAPSKPGYTFNGWYNYGGTITNPERIYIKIIPKGTNDDISVYADYIKNSSSNSSSGSSGSSGGSGSSSGSGGGRRVGSATSYQNTPGDWKQNEYGWWFQKTDGSYPKDEWVMHNNVWYHFDTEGYMQTGWIELNNSKYFLNPDGSMISNNWSLQDGKWYFFNSDGSMKIGWVQWNGLWYYMNPDGTMAINITTPDGYIISDDGVWIQ